MSRGPGAFQDRLLETVQERPGSLRNALLWSSAEAAGRVVREADVAAGLSTGRIDATFEKQFNRALLSLLRRKLLRVDRRPIGEWKEFIEYHPFQTTRLEVRELRRTLLPALIVEEAFYSRSGNEDHIVRSFSRENGASARNQWRVLEPRLRDAFSANPRADQLLYLIIRGREMFHSVGVIRLFETQVSCTASLTSLVKDTQVQDACGAALAQELQVFAETYLPSAEITRQQSKSRLFVQGHFGGAGKSTLHQHVKDRLYELHPVLISSLPGHEGPKNPYAHLGIGPQRKYSPLLDKVIDRGAFRMLEFVS